MEIVVRKIDGKEHKIEMKTIDTIYQLKELIEEIDGIPIDQQRLIFDGQQVRDDKTAMYYNIVGGSVLDLILRLKGCDCHCGLDPGHEMQLPT